jgi:hypothetical protein
LNRAIGATLINNGISIDDAESGNVHELPHMAGVAAVAAPQQ